MKQNADLNKVTVAGSVPHLKQLSRRLKFLSFLLENSELGMNVEQVDTLWQYLVQNSLTKEEFDFAMKWFEEYCGNTAVFQVSLLLLSSLQTSIILYYIILYYIIDIILYIILILVIVVVISIDIILILIIIIISLSFSLSLSLSYHFLITPLHRLTLFLMFLPLYSIHINRIAGILASISCSPNSAI